MADSRRSSEVLHSFVHGVTPVRSRVLFRHRYASQGASELNNLGDPYGGHTAGPETSFSLSVFDTAKSVIISQFDCTTFAPKEPTGVRLKMYTRDLSV